MFLENMVICTDEPTYGTVIEWLMTVCIRDIERLVLFVELLNFSLHAKDCVQSNSFMSKMVL